jgi:mannitol/fructose-specific phosphotransferase system IIA component (Ntr-type)
MNVEEGLSQARKGDIALFITEEHNSLTIATSRNDMSLVKNEIYEVILELSHNIKKLKESANTTEMRKDLLDTEARTTKDIIALIDPHCFELDLKGETKKEIITELIDILDKNGKLLDRDLVLFDVLERERTMSTGMGHGIAMPHAKTDGIADTAVVFGVKKAGIDFDSLDKQPSKLFVLTASPKKSCNLYVQFLAGVGSIVGDKTIREAIYSADTPQDAVDLIKKRKTHHN